MLATVEDRVYVAHFYGPASKGTLKHLDPTATYKARWFDPRKGEYPRAPLEVRAPSGQWDVPPKPDAQDWVLILQRPSQDDKGTTKPSSAPAGRPAR